MRVLITGGSGQLGGALQRTAPTGIDLNAISSDDVDFADTAMLRARIVVEAADVVINAAAYTAVDRAENDEAMAYAVNAEAVGVIADCLESTGGKLVHVSTDFVFDGRASRPYRPRDGRAPMSVYGRSKAAGEDHLREEDLLVRTSWLYEAGGANFVTTMVRLMKERDKLSVVNDQIGAPTRATGLAKSIWGLIAKDAAGIYHHCDQGSVSWYEFAVAIGEEALQLGMIEKMPEITPISSEEFGAAAKRPAFSVLDCTSTRAALNDEPTHWRTNLISMLKEEQCLA